MNHYRGKAVYEWKGDYAQFKTGAQETGEYLEELSSQTGETLTAKGIVDDARPEGAFLHPNFEWRDEVAAEKHRESQARSMIRSLVMVGFKGEKDVDLEEKTRAIVYVKESGYRWTVPALQEPDTANKIIAAAKEELQAFQRKYRSYKELHNLVKEVGRLERSIEVYTN